MHIFFQATGQITDEALAKTKISKDKDKEETQETDEALRLKIILKII